MITADNRPQQRDREGKILKGIKGTRLYTIWHTIHLRCYNPNNKDYHNYGERGITVCEEWSYDSINGYYNFKAWAIENGYNEDLSIDRIDSNGNYEPSNCRWSTMKEQQRNRRNNKPITVNGKEYRTLSEAIEALGRTEDYNTIYSRINQYGWTADKAFNEPITHRAFNTPITHGERQYKSKPITVNGVQYKSISECCRDLNINRKAVECYMHRHKVTAEEAIQHYLEERA